MDLLLRAGLVTPEQMQFALREKDRTGARIGQILVDRGMIPEVVLYDVLARQTGFERLNLATIVVDHAAAHAIDFQWAMSHGMLPLSIDAEQRRIVIAAVDPGDIRAVDEITFRTGYRARILLGSDTEVQRLIRHVFYHEPLDRNPLSAQRIGQPTAKNIEINDSMIVHGMEAVRDIVQQSEGSDEAGLPLNATISDMQLESQIAPSPYVPQVAEARAWTPELTPRPSVDAIDDGRELLARLKPIFDAQQDAARTLQIVFELCVSRGIVTREEYLDRLRRIPD